MAGSETGALCGSSRSAYAGPQLGAPCGRVVPSARPADVECSELPFSSGSNSEMKLYLVLPTFRREEALRRVLVAVGQQTLLPTMTIVVDNASSLRCAEVVAQVADDMPQHRVMYVDAGDNTGSAGGTAIGMRVALRQAEDDDWIMRCDDDLLPPAKDFFEVIVAEGRQCLARDPLAGALGRAGARYDVRRSRLSKPSHDSGNRFVLVDYLATGWCPIYRVSAVRDVGVFRSDLFFGLTEVEYGLRMTRRGYHLYRLDLPEHKRAPASQAKRRLEAPTWRRYYSLRNQIVIHREYFGVRSAVRVAIVVGVLKPLANIIATPGLALQHLKLNLKAIFHAFRGRLGRTVEPTLTGGELDRRSGT